jgi:hypothetical protein
VDQSLLPAAAAVIDDLPDARSDSVDGTVTWTRQETTFAVFQPDAIEIRLDPEIAAAATKTPDALGSTRGPEWIRFGPRELDAHALNRLRAWLQLAYRRAER